jgi:hypothetical protein
MSNKKSFIVTVFSQQASNSLAVSRFVLLEETNRFYTHLLQGPHGRVSLLCRGGELRLLCLRSLIGCSTQNNVYGAMLDIYSGLFYWPGFMGECIMYNIFFKEVSFLLLFSLLARSRTTVPSKVAENKSVCQKSILRLRFC